MERNREKRTERENELRIMSYLLLKRILIRYGDTTMSIAANVQIDSSLLLWKEGNEWKNGFVSSNSMDEIILSAAAYHSFLPFKLWTFLLLRSQKIHRSPKTSLIITFPFGLYHSVCVYSSKYKTNSLICRRKKRSFPFYEYYTNCGSKRFSDI